MADLGVNLVDGPESSKDLKNGAIWKTVDYDQLKCETSFQITDIKTECHIHNLAHSSCARCKMGSFLDSPNCVDNFLKKPPYFVDFQDPVISFKDSRDSPGVGFNRREWLVDFTGPGTAAPHSVPFLCDYSDSIRSPDTSSLKVFNFEHTHDFLNIDIWSLGLYRSEEVHFSASFDQYSCVKFSSLNKYYSHTNDFSFDNFSNQLCMFFGHEDGFYRCLGCKIEYQMLLRRATLKCNTASNCVDNSSQSDPFLQSIVSDCIYSSNIFPSYSLVPQSTMTRNFQGLNYNLDHSVRRLSLFLTVDSCATGSLVVFGQEHMNTLVPQPMRVEINNLDTHLFPFACFSTSHKGPITS